MKAAHFATNNTEREHEREREHELDLKYENESKPRHEHNTTTKDIDLNKLEPGHTSHPTELDSWADDKTKEAEYREKKKLAHKERKAQVERVKNDQLPMSKRLIAVTSVMFDGAKEAIEEARKEIQTQKADHKEEKIVSEAEATPNNNPSVLKSTMSYISGTAGSLGNWIAHATEEEEHKFKYEQTRAKEESAKNAKKVNTAIVRDPNATMGEKAKAASSAVLHSSKQLLAMGQTELHLRLADPKKKEKRERRVKPTTHDDHDHLESTTEHSYHPTSHTDHDHDHIQPHHDSNHSKHTHDEHSRNIHNDHHPKHTHNDHHPKHTHDHHPKNSHISVDSRTVDDHIVIDNDVDDHVIVD